jgi:hypothetical protein
LPFVSSWVGTLTEDQKLTRLTAREYIASLQEIKLFVGVLSKKAGISEICDDILVAEIPIQADRIAIQLAQIAIQAN